jgi:hypothetical protein
VDVAANLANIEARFRDAAYCQHRYTDIHQHNYTTPD